MLYLRRILSYFATRLLLVALIFALLVVGFYMGLNSANIYVVLQDGMALRASIIIGGHESNQLGDYFEDYYMMTDQALYDALNGESPYYAYKVSDYNHSVSLKWVWSWPWSDTAQAEITETVTDITGRVLASYADKELAGELSSDPPAWNNGRYRVQFVKSDGRWRINQTYYLDASQAG